MGFTLVAFHAHPDDEALLTGGTLARAASEGHRVVLVTATAGEAGLAATPAGEELRTARLAELEASARALGVARTVLLGYADSGSAGPVPEGSFADLDPQGPAERLAALLREEAADVLTTYDARGGYGHRDHVQVHRVGALAARLAGTPVVLEATIDQARLTRLARVLARVPGVGRLIPPDRFAGSYTPHAELTHRVDVRPHLGAKRAALAAHATQATGGSVRTVGVLLRLPDLLLAPVLGTEWFREPGRPRPSRLLDDVFASVR